MQKNEVIQVFVPGLPDTPGWVALPYKKQQAIVEHTSRIQQNRKLQLYGEIGELMELHEVEQLLEGEQMKMRSYLTKLYPDKTYRTISRKQKWFKELQTIAPPGAIKRLGAVIANHHDSFERITTAALGDIRNAIKEVPRLPASTEKDAEVYWQQVDTKILENRKRKAKGKPLQKNEEEATKNLANAVIHFVNLTGLKTTAQRSKMLVRAIGWAMQNLGIGGTMRCHQLPIPDGVLVRRGRPRMTEEEKRKAKLAREAKKRREAS